MIGSRILLVAMVLTNTTAFGMFLDLFTKKEADEVQSIVVEEAGLFECIVPRIKDLAQKEERWKKIVDDRWATGALLHSINMHSRSEFCKKNPDTKWYFDMRTRNGFDHDLRDNDGRLHEEIAAALLGTPGAIALGKDCIKYPYNNYEAKKRLQTFVFDVVRLGHQKDEIKNSRWRLSWPDEDVDVVRAGLAMGLDHNMIDDDFLGGYKRPLLVSAAEMNKVNVVTLLLNRGVYIETKCYIRDYRTYENDYFGRREHESDYTALHCAAMENCIEAVDLLIEREANINAIGGLGRTALILAVIRGHVEMVKKLLTVANINVTLADGYKKTALQYAQQYLNNKDRDKEKYQIIVQLLKDAGA